jgi:hypothetical protein
VLWWLRGVDEAWLTMHNGAEAAQINVAGGRAQWFIPPSLWAMGFRLRDFAKMAS